MQDEPAEHAPHERAARRKAQAAFQPAACGQQFEDPQLVAISPLGIIFLFLFIKNPRGY